MEMDDHYNIDLRHFITGHHPPPPPPLSVDLFPTNHHQLPHHYDRIPRDGQFHSGSANPPPPSLLPSPSANCGSTSLAGGFSTPSLLDTDAGRWPRQETLTLLEIRSRLHSNFKEANHKGPLWDQVSRIMYEEYGYQRSGKKCKEKLENLYKYYKKTKEGKAARQDGKHYRFFRQLEALYGETTNPHFSQPGGASVPFNSSFSLSNSSEFGTFSSEDYDHDHDSSRRKRRSWKEKIKELFDFQARKLTEKQETWMEKLTRTLEQREQERRVKEEEWRNQEAARVEKEHNFWAKERAWIEARDAALMDTMRKLINSKPHENSDLSNKKRKENSNSCYYPSNYSYGEQEDQETEDNGTNQENAGVSENCFPLLTGEENLWES